MVSSDSLCLPRSVKKNRINVGSTAVLPERVSPPLCNPKIHPTIFSNSTVLHDGPTAGAFGAWFFLLCGIKKNAGTFLYDIPELTLETSW